MPVALRELQRDLADVRVQIRLNTLETRMDRMEKIGGIVEKMEKHAHNHCQGCDGLLKGTRKRWCDDCYGGGCTDPLCGGWLHQIRDIHRNWDREGVWKDKMVVQGMLGGLEQEKTATEGYHWRTAGGFRRCELAAGMGRR